MQYFGAVHHCHWIPKQSRCDFDQKDSAMDVSHMPLTVIYPCRPDKKKHNCAHHEDWNVVHNANDGYEDIL